MEVQQDGYYGEIATVSDYLGPKPSLPENLEKTIKCFIQDCMNIGLPRSERMCARDIQTYVRAHNIPVPRFKDQLPGNYFDQDMKIVICIYCFNVSV